MTVKNGDMPAMPIKHQAKDGAIRMSDLIEPSNADYGGTPDSVRDYIHGLEQQVDEQQQRIDELEKQNAEALLHE